MVSLHWQPHGTPTDLYETMMDDKHTEATFYYNTVFFADGWD